MGLGFQPISARMQIFASASLSTYLNFSDADVRIFADLDVDSVKWTSVEISVSPEIISLEKKLCMLLLGWDL